MSFAEEAADACDTAFAAFGVPAQYTPPGGTAAPCRIIQKSADRQVNFGEGRPFAEGITVEVRASEIATPVVGGQFVPGTYVAGAFTPGGVILTIIGDPEVRDELRLVWSCRVSQ